MIQISERLQHAAAMVTPGNRLADVGTDHGYVPIYLIQKGIIPNAIAMDINAGPLERAKEHIEQYGLGGYIQTRQSDGVAALQPQEADSILIAGMGGGLVMHILTDGKNVCTQAKELILQPQSELERVRRFLDESGYVVDEEDMVLEEGKFYPMMRVHYEKEHAACVDELSYLYGKKLLNSQNKVLLQYLQQEKRVYDGIRQNLVKMDDSPKIKTRLKEVEQILARNQKAISYFE